MSKFIKLLGLVACLSTVGMAASFAQNGQGQNGNGQGQNGGGAPAPEIGATALGLLGAAGLAAYIRARRRG